MPNISHFRLREPAIYSPNQAMQQGKMPLFQSTQIPPRFQDTRADMQWIGSIPTRSSPTYSGGSSSGVSFKDRLLQALAPLRP